MDSLGVFAPLWAYFDPGSGSLVLQALVGGVAGCMVMVRYLWNCAPTLFKSRQSLQTSPLSEAEIEIRL